MLPLVLLLCFFQSTPPPTTRATPEDPTTIPAEPPATPVTRPAPREGIGTAVYVGNDVIWNYDPTPALVTPETIVEQAKFPCVDVHCHWGMEQDPAAMLEAMDLRNVAYAVNLSGGESLEQLRPMLEKFSDERFLIFCNLDYDHLGEDDYYRQYLKAAKAAGVRGLKVWKNLGLTLRDREGKLVPVDDPRLDVIWETCAELDLPVLIHVADPVAFFQPIDEKNERWMQLRRHPDWSFYGPEFPSREAILDQRDRMIAKHPETIFIGAHVANNAENLAEAAERMRKLPNLYADISGRVAELGRQPYSARRFILEFQDRILFGTDRYPGRLDQPRYRIYFRFLETADEYFKPYDHPFAPSGDWRIHGIFLPDAVLRKVYYNNAARILSLPKRDTGVPPVQSTPDAQR